MIGFLKWPPTLDSIAFQTRQNGFQFLDYCYFPALLFMCQGWSGLFEPEVVLRVVGK